MEESPVDQEVTEAFRPRTLLLTYPGAITLSERTLTFLTRQLRAHRVTIGNPWRKLPAHR